MKKANKQKNVKKITANYELNTGKANYIQKIKYSTNFAHQFQLT